MLHTFLYIHIQNSSEQNNFFSGSLCAGKLQENIIWIPSYSIDYFYIYWLFFKYILNIALNPSSTVLLCLYLSSIIPCFDPINIVELIFCKVRRNPATLSKTTHIHKSVSFSHSRRQPVRACILSRQDMLFVSFGDDALVDSLVSLVIGDRKITFCAYCFCWLSGWSGTRDRRA